MLEFLKVKNPAQVRSLLKTYDPLRDTWIVSDLKSKQEIQNLSVQQHGYFTDDAIMRVSDFWRLWIRRIEPTLQVVSSDFIRSLVQHFVDAYGEELDVLDSEVSTLNKAVQEFAPLLLHPASGEVLDEWLSQQQTEKKWVRWYKIAKICLSYIVDKERAIDAQWSAAYLQTLDLNLFSWPRRLFVDLGSELSTVEMGLLKYLSQTQHVVVITPDPEWKEKFPYLLNTYKENFGYGSVRELSGDESVAPALPEQFVRVSTQLAEVKFAVAQVRKWLDAGVAAEKIALIAPDIEKYWPVLQMYLDIEGVPCSKDSVARLNSLGDIQNLLAALKNYSREVAWDSLEKSFFAKDGLPGFRYEKFKSLFYQLYDEDDLGREQKIKELFYRQVDFSAPIDRDGFLAFAVKIWISLPDSQKKNDLFEPVFKDFLGQSFNISMKFSGWVQFFKNRLSRKEITVERGPEGIAVLPLMSAQMTETSHRFYMGLNDEDFHRRQNSLLSLADSMTLRTQFDLAVDYSEESYLDFNLRWQSMGAGPETVYTSAHLSFSSEPLNASLFFIENRPVSNVQPPPAVRADELQRDVFLKMTEDQPSGSFAADIGADVGRLQQDLRGYEAHVPSEVFRSLSVGDIEDYAKCSFKLLASKGFRLRDLPQISLDLDPRQKGSLVHALFEYCIHQLSEGRDAVSGAGDFLDQKRLEFGLYRQQDPHWNIQRQKLLLLAQRFQNFEKSRLQIFSAQAEKSFTMYFDLKAGDFCAQPPEHGFHFSFRVDRIDIHRQKKYAVIFDYKSSSFQVSNFSSWLTDNQFQMLLYMLALELNENAEGAVKAALYYQYKNFDLKKGVVESQIAVEDFGMTKRNRSLIAEEDLIELKKQFREKMSDILKKLDVYLFNTAPEDLEVCQTCDWRKLCRATHLM